MVSVSHPAPGRLGRRKVAGKAEDHRREIVARPVVPRVISPEHRVGDVVGELVDARSSRVHEERRVRQVPDHSPLGAQDGLEECRSDRAS